MDRAWLSLAGVTPGGLPSVPMFGVAPAADGPGGGSRLAEFERVLPLYFIRPLTDSRWTGFELVTLRSENG